MWRERNTLDSLLWEAAVDDMGIYLKATVINGVETPRTEREEGWNDAVFEITKRHELLTGWVAKLPEGTVSLLQKLLDSDGEPVSLAVRDGAVTLLLRCGDTFSYACADAEEFTVDDLPEVHRLWTEHGYCGVVAWIARKRGVDPVKEYRYSAQYLKAKSDLAAMKVKLRHGKDNADDAD